MELTGQMFIGAKEIRGSESEVRSYNPATGASLEPAYAGADASQIAAACICAEQAFEPYAALSLEARAGFLDSIADAIEDLGEGLIERCMQETGLPQARLLGERARTCNQLRLFAQVVRSGEHVGARIDRAMPERQPAPRPDLRLRMIPLGPVAVFGASNFPLAFSVAGGDTASALAAGCPVVVKAHPAHLGTSELVARAVLRAAEASGMPDGVFSLIVGADNAAGQALVSDPRIKAVGFTGSRQGGLALISTANRRAEPIPVYAEMSSINPVLLLPAELAAHAEDIAKSFVAALTLGAGQFCTNPGLVLAVQDPALDRFVSSVASILKDSPAATMLSANIHGAYCRGVDALAAHDAVEQIAIGQAGDGFAGRAALFATDADTFLSDPKLQDEVFGAAGLIVRCHDAEQLRQAIEQLEGQLTIALHIGEEDHALARSLLPLLERKAGRIVTNGFGTGVEVAHAMVHGGPYPATSDSRTTSVGSLAINRFLRPVCYQDLPQDLLPDVLTDAHLSSIPVMLDGERCA